MKLTIEREALLGLLHAAKQVVSTKHTIPILSHVVLKADSERLGITATNIDITITNSAECSVAEVGAVTVPYDRLHGITQRLPKGSKVTLATAEDKLNISSGRARFSLLTLPVADFPISPPFEAAGSFCMPGRDLVRLLDQVDFAAVKDQPMFILRGVFLTCVSDKLRAVATDGHRLAVSQVDVDDGMAFLGEIGGVIIHKNTVAQIMRICDVDFDVKVEINARRISVQAGRLRIESSLIDGTFPDYERVIPTRNEKVLRIGLESFLDVVSRVAAVQTNQRRLKLAIGSGQIVVSVNQDGDEAIEECDASWSEKDFAYGMNSRYIADILEHIKGHEVDALFSDPRSAVILRASGTESPTYVLMPLYI